MEAAPPLLMGFLRYTIKLLNYYGQGVDTYTYSNSWTGRTERCIIYLFSYYYIFFSMIHVQCSADSAHTLECGALA